VYATDKKGGYLIPKVQVDDLKSLKTRLKKLCRKKDWEKKFIYNQRVEITITDGRYSWYDSIRVYLNIENGILYTKDNKVWNWEFKFVEE
jgi:hypothetical protein